MPAHEAIHLPVFGLSSASEVSLPRPAIVRLDPAFPLEPKLLRNEPASGTEPPSQAAWLALTGASLRSPDDSIVPGDVEQVQGLPQARASLMACEQPRSGVLLEVMADSLPVKDLVQVATAVAAERGTEGIDMMRLNSLRDKIAKGGPHLCEHFAS